MRKRPIGLPVILLTILLSLSVLALGVYLIIAIQGKVSVEESIVVTPDSFVVSMYPGETEIQVVEITNNSSIDVIVNLSVTSTPAGLDVIIPDFIEVRSNRTETFDVDIFAPIDIEPGEFTVVVEINR